MHTINQMNTCVIQNIKIIVYYYKTAPEISTLKLNRTPEHRIHRTLVKQCSQGTRKGQFVGWVWSTCDTGSRCGVSRINYFQFMKIFSLTSCVRSCRLNTLRMHDNIIVKLSNCIRPQQCRAKLRRRNSELDNLKQWQIYSNIGQLSVNTCRTFPLRHTTCFSGNTLFLNLLQVSVTERIDCSQSSCRCSDATIHDLTRK